MLDRISGGRSQVSHGMEASYGQKLLASLLAGYLAAELGSCMATVATVDARISSS